jgi:hypothetical protein
MSSDRSQIAKIAAHTSWALTEDRSARTQPARDALLAKFEREVDPDGVLSSVERAIRAESARRAFYQRIALKSAQARRPKKGGGESKKSP